MMAFFQRSNEKRQKTQEQMVTVEESLGEVFPTLFVEFWGLPPLIPLLQCVNRLGFEICSVDSCQTEQGSLVTVI